MDAGNSKRLKTDNEAAKVSANAHSDTVSNENDRGKRTGGADVAAMHVASPVEKVLDTGERQPKRDVSEVNDGQKQGRTESLEEKAGTVPVSASSDEALRKDSAERIPLSENQPEGDVISTNDGQKQANTESREEEAEAAPVSASSNDATKKESADNMPLSKNQLKKRRRYEKAMAVKRRRKQQQKEAKVAKALAEGRNLDEEKRIQAERTKAGEGHKRREQFLLKRMKTAETSFQVCIDCSYGAQMTSKEIGSLSSQLRYSYAANKRSKNPCYLSVASLSGSTYENLTKVSGFPDQWLGRAFTYSEKPLIEMHPDKSKLVYLSADSENMIEHLDDSKIYIIGGIVDRNRLKGATMTKAKELGIQTARLPISSHLKLFTTKVLTCNHVFEILLKYREHGNDWKNAMLDVLPKRKDIEATESDGGKGEHDTDNS